MKKREENKIRIRVNFYANGFYEAVYTMPAFYLELSDKEKKRLLFEQIVPNLPPPKNGGRWWLDYWGWSKKDPNAVVFIDGKIISKKNYKKEKKKKEKKKEENSKKKKKKKKKHCWEPFVVDTNRVAVWKCSKCGLKKFKGKESGRECITDASDVDIVDHLTTIDNKPIKSGLRVIDFEE